MIEVFKTDVSNAETASWLVAEIQHAFAGYQVNFDLSDCDKILRVVCDADQFCIKSFTRFLQAKGCSAELLPD